MSKIVLYGPRAAPYTEKVRRALALKQLEFELREPQGPEDYKRWSPETGLLPVLKIDDELISDSTRILYRLDELFPEPPLLAADAKAAAQQRQLEDWADESFLFYFLKWQRLAAAKKSAREERERRGRASTLGQFAAWLRAGGTWERPEDDLMRQLGDRMNDLANFLGAREFFYSDHVTMADLAAYSMLFTMRNDTIPGSARLLAARPDLLAYMRRVEEATGG